MASFVDTRALADTSGNVLWSRYGEVLRLVDSTNISMSYLNDVLKRPQYRTVYRLFVLNPDETVEYEIPVDSDIEQAIIGILTLDNGSGYPLDLKPIIYDSTFKGRKMPYTLSKDAGGTLGEMLLEIGTILNAEIYYNSQGNLCVESINETTLDTQKSALWDYMDTERDYFNATTSYDFENAVNEVHVVGDNINNDIAYAMASNNNPASPLCIARIGRRVSYVNDSNIYSDDLAQQRAAYELRKASILNTTITLNVAFNPLLFVNNLVTITDEFYGFNRERFLIQSISYTIGNENQMTLSCSNIVNFDENELGLM